MSAWCPPPILPKAPQSRRQLVGCDLADSIQQLGGLRPLMITGSLRWLMTEHFGNPANIEDPMLRDQGHPAIWQNNNSTGILIESVFRWRGDLVEKRPAVLIKRNGYRNLRVTISDLVGADQQGNDSYATLWVGSHTLFAIHGTGASCEILSTEVQRDVTEFAPAILGKLNLHKFQVTEVGEISTVEEASQNFICPITVGWCYEEVWKLNREALPLKMVELKTLINMAKFQESK